MLARPDSPLQKVQRWISQHREKTLAILFGVLIMSFAVVMVTSYTHQEAMIRTQRHHYMLQHGQAIVSQKAQQLNEYFLRIEGMVKTLGESTVYMLGNPQPNNERVYLIADSFTPEKQAPGLVWSDTYAMKISPDWTGYIVKYWTRYEKVKPSMERLAPLRHDMKKMMADSMYFKRQASSPQELDQWIIDGKLPIRYVYFGLEEGIFFELPYQQRKVIVNANYREAPWYKLAKASGKTSWQPPYVTFSGLSNLPCTMPLYDAQHRFLGVLAVRMALEEVESQFIKLERPGVLETSIIDKSGQILLSSNRPKQALKMRDKEATAKFPILKSPWAMTALKNKAGGYFIETSANATIIYFYSYIKTQDWLYIVKADEATFLKHIES